MQLAINYSPQAAALLGQNAIVLDRFKLPNWDWLIAEAKAFAPVYVHFDLIAGDGKLAQRDWDTLERQLRETDTRYLNLHLFPRLSDFRWTAQPDKAGEARVIETMLRDIALAVSRVGAERVIVENIPLKRKDGAVTLCVNADVIRDVLRATGAGLLLDISHARLTCEALGWDVSQYLDALPLERTREVHVTGILSIEGQRRDHFGMQPDDWPFLDMALDKLKTRGAQPDLLSFEYGGVGERFEWRSETKVIAQDMPKLAERVRAFSGH